VVTRKHERLEQDERAKRTAAIGWLKRWADEADARGDEVARAVLILFGECSRLADAVPALEVAQLDAEILRAAVAQYRAELARVRGLLDATEK
jgi:hypothetical protein